MGPRDAEEQVASVGPPRHKDLDNLAPRKGPGPAWPPEAASRGLEAYPWCPRNIPGTGERALLFEVNQAHLHKCVHHPPIL